MQYMCTFSEGQTDACALGLLMNSASVLKILILPLGATVTSLD